MGNFFELDKTLMGFKTYVSQFFSSAIVYVIYKEYKKYSEIFESFQNNGGYSFVVPEQNTIIINGEKIKRNRHLLSLIESHEICHILLGHKGHGSDEDLEADVLSYHFLFENNYTQSLNLLLNNFKIKHGIEFPNNTLENLKKTLSLA